MSILRELTEIIAETVLTEISKSKKTELKKAQALERRLAAAADKKAEEERVARELAKRIKKKEKKLQAPVKTAKPEPERTGFLANPELRKYMVDPSVDTDFEGGYYLKFHTDMNGTTAYWSKGNLTFDQAAQFKQTQFMGRTFNEKSFEQLLDSLIMATSKGEQPGYVHIEIDRRFINNPFYTKLYSYLLREYPTDEPTVSASVNWELV